MSQHWPVLGAHGDANMGTVLSCWPQTPKESGAGPNPSERHRVQSEDTSRALGRRENGWEATS